MSQDLEEVILRRNNLLQKFFNKIFPNNIIIIGNPNAPAIVYDNSLCLSCYVHNFELRFTDAPDKGKVIYTVKLQPDQKYDTQEVLKWFKECSHRPMYKIAVNNTKPKLFLSGYNFLDRNNKDGKYPVFSLHHPKVYFTKEKALEIAQSLQVDGYNIEVC